MFAEMRRQDRLITQEEAYDVLSRGEYGILSMYDTSGYPYGIPLNYFCRNGKIYFHCARSAGQKAENLKRDERVCFTVVGKTELMPEQFNTKYESVVVFGRARRLEGKDKQDALEGLVDKYSAAFHAAGMQYIASAFEKVGIYEIAIDRITGKAKR